MCKTENTSWCMCKTLYRCPFCDYSVAYRGDLKEHISKNKKHIKEIDKQIKKEYISQIVQKSGYTQVR